MTRFSDTAVGQSRNAGDNKNMSDYYLADRRAEDRARRQEKKQPAQAQDIKITLLGDFLFASNEPPGCDPYNSTHGKSLREAWRARRDRR